MNVHDPAALLARLLREPRETPWLEFKRNNGDPDEIGTYVSALANAAMLVDRDRAYLVFGVDDRTRMAIGTTISLERTKKGGENLENYINRLIEPRLHLEFIDFNHDEMAFSIVVIEPSYNYPVRFAGTEYVRIGENKKKLRDHPEQERSLWLATGRRRFEDAIAASHLTADTIVNVLELDAYYLLAREPKPNAIIEILRRMEAEGFVRDNLQGRYDITNLGAILLAKDITQFPSIRNKPIRIVKYAGRDKQRSEYEQEERRGYAAGFASIMRSLGQRLPVDERYIDGVRQSTPAYPDTAIREILANALIHQDLTVNGAGPIIEIYDDRIEVTNPGGSLIAPDRMLDDRRSRNSKLARTMRQLGLCEERGGGLDKTMIAVEAMHLPAPEFISSGDSMRVVLFGPRAFGALSKADKQRTCFYHCVLRWLRHDPMSNTTLRSRFSLRDEDYQAVSAIIAEAIRAGRIAPADPKQGKRNARYVPYWAA